MKNPRSIGDKITIEWLGETITDVTIVRLIKPEHNDMVSLNYTGQMYYVKSEDDMKIPHFRGKAIKESNILEDKS